MSEEILSNSSFSYQPVICPIFQEQVKLIYNNHLLPPGTYLKW